MESGKRLAIALETCLREMSADQLKAHCVRMIDQLVRTLPKERGGSKVLLECRSHGRAAQVLGKPRRMTASLEVRTSDESNKEPTQIQHESNGE